MYQLKHEKKKLKQDLAGLSRDQQVSEKKGRLNADLTFSRLLYIVLYFKHDFAQIDNNKNYVYFPFQKNQPQQIDRNSSFQAKSSINTTRIVSILYVTETISL